VAENEYIRRSPLQPWPSKSRQHSPEARDWNPDYYPGQEQTRMGKLEKKTQLATENNG
jgi:hypothetical protein